jgi:hypothetical protein
MLPLALFDWNLLLRDPLSMFLLLEYIPDISKSVYVSETGSIFASNLTRSQSSFNISVLKDRLYRHHIQPESSYHSELALEKLKKFDYSLESIHSYKFLLFNLYSYEFLKTSESAYNIGLFFENLKDPPLLRSSHNFLIDLTEFEGIHLNGTDCMHPRFVISNSTCLLFLTDGSGIPIEFTAEDYQTIKNRKNKGRLNCTDQSCTALEITGRRGLVLTMEKITCPLDTGRENRKDIFMTTSHSVVCSIPHYHQCTSCLASNLLPCFSKSKGFCVELSSNGFCPSDSEICAVEYKSVQNLECSKYWYHKAINSGDPNGYLGLARLDPTNKQEYLIKAEQMGSKQAKLFHAQTKQDFYALIFGEETDLAIRLSAIFKYFIA